MSRFLKIRGFHVGHQHSTSGSGDGLNPKEKPVTSFVNIYNIDEICDGTPIPRRDDAGEVVKDEDDKPIFAPHVWLKMLHPFNTANSGDSYAIAYWIVEGDAQSWAARVEEAILADRRALQPAEDGGLKITDRDVWRPGESYEPFDLVAHPDDVSKKLVALRPSQSTSPAVLTNSKFWGPVGG